MADQQESLQQKLDKAKATILDRMAAANNPAGYKALGEAYALLAGTTRP